VEAPTLLGPLKRANLNHWTTHVEAEVKLRPTVSRQVYLGVGLPSGTDASPRICTLDKQIKNRDHVKSTVHVLLHLPQST
jgi:hypothetical protein